MTNRALGSRVKRGFEKIKSELPYIIELRDRFKALPRGKANIDNCTTWTQFCELRLHRTYRRIQQVLAEETEMSVSASVEKVPERETHIPIHHAAQVELTRLENTALAVRDNDD